MKNNDKNRSKLQTPSAVVLAGMLSMVTPSFAHSISWAGMARTPKNKENHIVAGAFATQMASSAEPENAQNKTRNRA
ncbi:hypothetical protein U5A82_02525 [Sphingobium sp. CR2-8]|uniref:hypothetical protein n=1 Tax=Sphingobium sp. CR2-8 TaxID=1306534 RepID=UPI002DBCDA04|nr:hypothetical protein [Sphingobium sp. CR2-8]MEC3909389.1 hypothetical protein [Sphingobium sp. CR2-8]